MTNRPQIKTNVSCTNPECSNLITITVNQKRKLFTENYKKYGKVSPPYCCKACQVAHQAELAGTEFFVTGNLKNHESARIRKGIEFKKRFRKQKQNKYQEQVSLYSF